MDVSTSPQGALRAAIRQAAFEHGAERRPQRWLAEVTGIHESDISRIATGRLDPGEAHARAIANALDSSCTALGWPQYEPAPGTGMAA